MKTMTYRTILIVLAFAFGVLPLLLCGCQIRLKPESGASDAFSEARETMTEILEAATLKPVPDDRFTPPQPSVPPPDSEPLEPLMSVPAGWPDGVMVQKFSTDFCDPCTKWDMEQRAKMEGVMMPDIIAWDENGRRSPEAAAAGVDGIPWFQLKRGNQILWHGKGYFTAEMLTLRAIQFGGRN